jgi:hypothetical protein
MKRVHISNFKISPAGEIFLADKNGILAGEDQNVLKAATILPNF